MYKEKNYSPPITVESDNEEEDCSMDEGENDCCCCSMEDDKKDNSYNSRRNDKEVRKKLIIDKLIKLLNSNGDDLSDEEKQFVYQLIQDPNESTWIKKLKIALGNAKSRNQVINLLRTMPIEWSNRKVSREFGVSRRVASIAGNLRKEKGYNSNPDPKKGRPIDPAIKKAVQEFYLSDSISRVMPGAKDFKSVVIDGKKYHLTVSVAIFLNIFPANTMGHQCMCIIFCYSSIR